MSSSPFFFSDSRHISSLHLRHILCGCCFAILTLVASNVMAQGGSVRYSYEKVSIGEQGERWVLVPHAELSLATGKKGVTKAQAIDAFNLLKKKKSSSYGDAKISIGRGAWPKSAGISVTIDKNYAAYAPIVIAEVVYTLTEMGITGVSFPGYASGTLERKDVPFAVYTLTLPAWMALPPGTVSASQVTLNDGTVVDAGEFYSRWKSNDKKLQEDIFASLESDNLVVVAGVLENLPKMGISFGEKVLPLLAHENVTVRRRALNALVAERDEKVVLDAVAKRIDAEKDATLLNEVVTFLGQSKSEQYAVLEQLWLLEKASDETLAVKAAGDIVKFKKDDRVTPALYAQLLGSRKAVASASAKALATLDDDAAQIKALSESKIPTALKKEIAADLAEDKDTSARIAGYVYLAENSSERDASKALASLGEIKGDDARKSLEAFLLDKAEWRRQEAATVLAKQGDVGSVPAFSKAIKTYEDDAALERAGYTIMLAQPLNTIQEQAKSRDNITQRLAYLALGEKARSGSNKGVFDTLKSGTQNNDPLIRGASARAIGVFANKEAAEVLESLKKDKSATVRRDVAIALGEFKGGEMADVLVTYIDDASPEVVAAAIDSLGARSEGMAWDQIRSEVNSKHPEVRANALRALARLVNRQDKVAVTEMIGLLSGAVNDKNVMIRRRAIEQLGTFKDENAVLAISSQLSGDDVSVRVTALEALAQTKHPSATELITDALDDPELDVRYAATEALVTLGDARAKSKLEAQIKQEKNKDLKQFMEQSAKKL